MRQAYRAPTWAQAPAPDHAAPGAKETRDPSTESPEHDEHAVVAAEYAGGYSADRAAIAFGILRIAPVLRPRATSQPVLPAEVEDLTESLTADERQAEGAFADHQLADLPEAHADSVVESELSDPVTAALRLPGSRGGEARPAWGEEPRQPHTERLVVPPALALAARSPLAQRWTAVLPQLDRGPGEAATTTVTLPPTPGSAAAFKLATGAGAGADEPSHFRRAKWVLLGAGAVLTLLIAALAGRALTLADVWPGAAPPSTPLAPHPAYRERLLEQAVAALRDGRREQAVGLLLRYQASEPAQNPDRTVEIMLRVLKKDLGTLGPR